MKAKLSRRFGLWLLLGFLGLTAVAYWPGLSGGWLFDDYPNIVDNHGVQPQTANVATLVRAALSSPSSEFKRPLASLSFAANYLAGGLNPWGWKAINLLIHLLNGLLIYILACRLLRAAARNQFTLDTLEDSSRTRLIAALIVGSWMLLPINITAVLYVVQRMESMANLFVLLGLIGYVSGRERMLVASEGNSTRGWLLCGASLVLATFMGVMAKETAVMLPLYAALVEWIVFRFKRQPVADSRKDARILSLFVAILLLPMIAGLAWLTPGLLNPTAWATRDFTMGTRLLSEARIVVDYIVWTLLPTPHALSFYHDDFKVSASLLQPWTTLACILVLVALLASIFALRKRHPIAALGLALFFGCHLLTATVLPLELIFEHRNYFASFGLMLVVVPMLAPVCQRLNFTLARSVLLGGLLLLWAGQTVATAVEWRNPLSMAESLAARRPTSPRAQYELGRTYIILSNYDPASPFTKLAYAPLERSAALPDSSILPEQALIFFNARMHLPIKDAWWDSLIAKLKAHKPGVQDESSLAALTKCVRDRLCDLPVNRMMAAFMAALSHPHPDARLLANYSDYAWNVLDDRPLGLHMAEDAVKTDPGEPAYRITLVRMQVASGHIDETAEQMKALQRLDIGGRLDNSIHELQHQIDATPQATDSTAQP
ncbi:MAG: hypothetical protein EPN68_01335 [Rhodanobacter sp.]|nr:MAG: hypothetical protein EPN68_01335 [Rhodanobacter sp.]